MPRTVQIGPSYNIGDRKLSPMMKEISQRKFPKDLFFHADDGKFVGAHKIMLGAQSKFIR